LISATGTKDLAATLGVLHDVGLDTAIQAGSSRCLVYECDAEKEGLTTMPTNRIIGAVATNGGWQAECRKCLMTSLRIYPSLSEAKRDEEVWSHRCYSDDGITAKYVLRHS